MVLIQERGIYTMNNRNIFSIILVLIVVISSSTFIVDEREVAIKFRLGEIVKTYQEPGLYFMIPFVNNVKRYDSRLLTMDSKPEQFLTSEKKNVIVDSFVKWRITGPENFYRSSKGDERIGINRLSQIINDLTKSEFSKRTINDVVSGDRAALMQIVTTEANKASEALGITVVDVRVKKVDLPDEVSNSVYARMVKERATVAKTFRSEGKEEAQGITALAERESETIIAEAYKTSQDIKGQGDAISTEVFAKAYNMDPEFYSFYRSLAAYKETFSAKQDVLVIQPDSDFFKYFNNSKGRK